MGKGGQLSYKKHEEIADEKKARNKIEGMWEEQEEESWRVEGKDVVAL